MKEKFLQQLVHLNTAKITYKSSDSTRFTIFPSVVQKPHHPYYDVLTRQKKKQRENFHVSVNFPNQKNFYLKLHKSSNCKFLRVWQLISYPIDYIRILTLVWRYWLQKILHKMRTTIDNREGAFAPGGVKKKLKEQNT